MRIYVCLLTSLVFAAHALLGCGVHRTCEHRTAILNGQSETHADHDCLAHHSSHDEEPGNGEHERPAPCSHSACSYVKAETQQVDLSNDVVVLWAALLPVDAGQGNPIIAALDEPVCRADLSSTQLYVWHCALII